MQALDHADFLALWEAGSRLHPLDRGLLAIGASLPAERRDGQIADWPLGRRNRALAALRTLYFGSQLEGWTECAGCGEKLEFELDCRALGEGPGSPPGSQVGMDGCSFRLPTSRDLARIADEGDPAQAVIRLLQSCLIPSQDKTAGESEVEEERDAIASWPVEKMDAVAERMAEADPLAEISISVQCPLCQHASEETLDLAGFLWTEIEARARRLLSEVHVLASVYGWTEGAILALSDVRRAAYLQMVQA